MLVSPGGGVPNPPSSTQPSTTSARPAPAPAQDPNAALSGLLNLQLGGIGDQANYQQAGINMAAGVDQGNLTTSNASLLQQLQDTLAGVGISQTGIGEEAAYQRGQYGLGQQQLGLEKGYAGQQYGFERQQQALSGRSLAEQLANLQAQYGLQQRGFGIEAGQLQLGQQQALEGMGAAGTFATGATRAQEQAGFGLQEQQLGLSEAQAAQAHKFGLQQVGTEQQQLGLTGREQQAAYANQMAQYGLQGQQAALSNTYQQQQIQNALANLGLSRTEAGQQYTQGTQANYNNYLAGLAGLLGQQGGVYGGEAQAVSGLLGQLFGAGAYTG